MAENKCNYKLKGKYNGVYGYTNEELTDKKAEKLVKEHARGYDLFAVLPVEIQKKIDEQLATEEKNAKNNEATRLRAKLDRQIKTEEVAKILIRKEAIEKGLAEAKEKRRIHKQKMELRKIKK